MHYIKNQLAHFRFLSFFLLQIAVYSRREQADQMNLALDAMKQIIPFYEEFFAIDYPLAKQGEPFQCFVKQQVVT